jgi:hypothetical protein
MDINQFVSPADEEVNNNLLELNEMILSIQLINKMRRKMMILQSLSLKFHLRMP